MSSQASTPAADIVPTERTKVVRGAARAVYERAAIDAILDEALICHVAVDYHGSPRVLPTAHVRIGDVVYLHGARKNALLGAMASGAPVCVTATLLDGLVFARRAFSHSMNYRCVVLYGCGREVTDAQEKSRALTALVDHMAPGRSLQCIPASEAELEATLVVSVPITEGSAKVRTGPPLDAAAMHDAPYWSGVVPLSLQAGAAMRDPTLRSDIPLCDAVRARVDALHGPALEGRMMVRR